MRIAIIYDSFFPINTGGGERVYRRIGESFANRGHAVDYLTRLQWSPGDEPQTTMRLVPVWSGEIYDATGVRTTSSALGFAFGVFRQLRAARKDYDVVVASALPVLTLLAARFALIGTDVFLIGDWLEFWRARKWRQYAGVVSGSIAFALQSVAVKVARLNTANSRFTADRIELATGESPVVLGLVDLTSGGEMTPVLASAPPYMVFVGRLIPDKRGVLLPEVLRVARNSFPDLRLVIVGVGPEQDHIVDAARMAGVSEHTVLLGRVSDDELHTIVARAAVLVNPSVREGFGLVVAEAASFGVPSVVVAGEDNASVDLIEEGINGFVAGDSGAETIGGAVIDAVSAGDRLRETTREWFEGARVESGIEASVDAILARYSMAR